MSDAQQENFSKVQKELITVMKVSTQLLEEDKSFAELSSTMEIVEGFSGVQKVILGLLGVMEMATGKVPSLPSKQAKEAKMKRSVEIYTELSGKTFTEEQILQMFKRASDE